ncbi:trimeric LpxA-like protein [Blastocladiella britannica]|nr:trimeric LpxA-like protein [Blastocladiella britannica]
MTTIVCQDAELRGAITLGVGTVIHPKAKIISTAGGPILIGRNNIIEEGVTIINSSTSGMVIGDDNLFEVNCYVASKYIGHYNIVEPRAHIGENTSIGENCVIGAMCSTATDEVIPSNTVIFGSDNQRRMQRPEAADERAMLHARHLEYLREILPKFNHTKRL